MEMLRGAHPGPAEPPPPPPPAGGDRSDSFRGVPGKKEEKARIFFLGNPLCKILSRGRGEGRKIRKKKSTKPAFYLERRKK